MTLEALNAAQTTAMQVARQLDMSMDSEIRISENRVHLYVTDARKFAALLETANIDFPDYVKITQVADLSRTTANIYAGLDLDPVCTTGFSVQHSSGTKGISTAGHCDNTLYYNGQPLTWQTQHRYSWNIRTYKLITASIKFFPVLATQNTK